MATGINFATLVPQFINRCVQEHPVKVEGSQNWYSQSNSFDFVQKTPPAKVAYTYSRYSWSASWTWADGFLQGYLSGNRPSNTTVYIQTSDDQEQDEQKTSETNTKIALLAGVVLLATACFLSGYIYNRYQTAAANAAESKLVKDWTYSVQSSTLGLLLIDEYQLVLSSCTPSIVNINLPILTYPLQQFAELKEQLDAHALSSTKRYSILTVSSAITGAAFITGAIISSEMLISIATICACIIGSFALLTWSFDYFYFNPQDQDRIAKFTFDPTYSERLTFSGTCLWFQSLFQQYRLEVKASAPIYPVDSEGEGDSGSDTDTSPLPPPSAPTSSPDDVVPPDLSYIQYPTLYSQQVNFGTGTPPAGDY